MGTFSTVSVGNNLELPHYAHPSNPIVTALAEDPIAAAMFTSCIRDDDPAGSFVEAINMLFAEGLLKYRWFGCNVDLVRAAVLSLLYRPEHPHYRSRYMMLEVYPPTPLKWLLGQRLQISEFCHINLPSPPGADTKYVLRTFWNQNHKHIESLYEAGIPKAIVGDLVSVMAYLSTGYVPDVYVTVADNELVVTLK